MLAPGTELREGLERIRAGHTGALIVLGENRVVEQISTGGFRVNADFTATSLRELAKMDGGILVSDDLDRIIAAGVHFVPSGELPTIETGTRHRTADRISQQANMPVVTVSAAMSTIALFMAGLRYPIESSEQILARANQALDVMSRYRERLQEQAKEFNELAAADQVRVRDVVQVAQPVEMIRRLADEIEGYVEALGVDGRLVQLQLYEATSGVDRIGRRVELSYARTADQTFTLAALHQLPTGELLDPLSVAEAMGLPGELDAQLTGN